MNKIKSNNENFFANNTAITNACPTSHFVLPACRFAEDARCRTCDNYSGGWCYKHKTWTDGDKWACSSYK